MQEFLKSYWAWWRVSWRKVLWTYTVFQFVLVGSMELYIRNFTPSVEIQTERVNPNTENRLKLCNDHMYTILNDNSNLKEDLNQCMAVAQSAVNKLEAIMSNPDFCKE